MADERIEAAMAVGRERLLGAEPELARRADARATEREGQLGSQDRMAIYEAEIDREIEEYAQSQGISVVQLLVRLGSDSDQAARALLAGQGGTDAT